MSLQDKTLRRFKLLQDIELNFDLMSRDKFSHPHTVTMRPFLMVISTWNISNQ